MLDKHVSLVKWSCVCAPGAAAERGGPAVQGGAARPAADHGEVQRHLPPHLRLLQRLQGQRLLPVVALQCCSACTALGDASMR